MSRASQRAVARPRRAQPCSDHSAREKLLASRTRAAIQLHPGWRRLFPAGATRAARRARHGLHPRLGHSGRRSISTAWRRRRRDVPTRLDELLAFVPDAARGFVATSSPGTTRALHARARAACLAGGCGWRMPRRPVRVRRPSSARRLPPPEDHRRRRPAGVLRRHRSDGPSLGHAAHRVEEPARTTPTGHGLRAVSRSPAMVCGPAAASLGALARDRWRTLGEEKCRRSAQSAIDLWPPDVTPDLTDVDVAVARTVPPSDSQPAIRECEALFLDSIARGDAHDLHRKPVLHERPAGRGAGRATAANRTDPKSWSSAPKECARLAREQHDGRLSGRRAFKRLTAADRTTGCGSSIRSHRGRWTCRRSSTPR